MTAAKSYVVTDVLRWAYENLTVEAIGRPSDAYKLGQEAVDKYGDALRRLADA